MQRHLAELIDDLAASTGPHAGEAALRVLDALAQLGSSRRPPRGRDPVALVERFFRRRTDAQIAEATQAVALAFDRMNARDRARVAEALGPRATAVAADLMRSERDADRNAGRNAGLALLEQTRSLALVPLAAGLIGQATPETARRAISAIETVAAEHDRITDPAFERALAAVLDAASLHDGPSYRGILRAALLMLSPGVRAGLAGRQGEDWLSRAPEATRLAIRFALRSLPGPAGVGRAFELLPRVDLRRAAAERIAAARDIVAQLATPDEPMTDAEARGLPGWLEAIGVPTDQRTLPLEPLLAHPDPLARLAAVRRGCAALRLDQSLDESPPIAKAAALRLAVAPEMPGAIRPIEPSERSLLLRSPHAAVRRLADRLPARGSLAPVSIVHLRREHARRPADVVSELAERIESGESAAIVLAGRLELGDELVESLAAVISGDDSRRAATAVRALAGARSDRAGSLLAAALDHADARVRSNAIEAAASRARRFRQEPADLRIDDPHHRPAATSIRVLLLAGTPAEDTPARVHDMLASSDPVRRAAALWLTERSAAELKPVAGRRWADIAARVAEAARHGETAPERERATRTARRMLAVTRA
jgi:hypothetical protein